LAGILTVATVPFIFTSLKSFKVTSSVFPKSLYEFIFSPVTTCPRTNEIFSVPRKSQVTSLPFAGSRLVIVTWILPEASFEAEAESAETDSLPKVYLSDVTFYGNSVASWSTSYILNT